MAGPSARAGSPTNPPAYAVWTGIGAVGTATIGILVFDEPTTVWRLVFIATLIGSIIGLKAVSAS